MKFRPCPKCKSTDISPRDCGYNTFNPGWAECGKCGHSVKAGWVEDSKDISIVKAWNKIPVDEQLKTANRKTRLLRKQLLDNDISPVV